MFFITNDSMNIAAYLITYKTGYSEREFYQKIDELRSKYDKVYFETYYDAMDELKTSFKINDTIYFSIIGILSIVFAITTNAVFVGIYDRRKQEFAFYRGIGINKRVIYRKVASEILAMNVIGLILGAVISVLTVTLLNDFIYHKDGLSMWYYHPTALLAVIICDLAILIPVIGLRILSISREVKDLNFL